jgi:protein associated with RNAse G/E
MAEDEVIKHTRKIYRTWFNKELSIWHKISEFFIEIIIIVFAVSLSIWFHNRSEHAHEQSEVKAFLFGLKLDLTDDIREMQNDKESYINQGKIFKYIASLKKSEPLSKDTLKKYRTSLFVTTSLNPNDGRFEGFKSSGKIGTIEDKALQNDIMDLYQEKIQALLASSNGYNVWKNNFLSYIVQNGKRLTDSTNNFNEMLKDDKVYEFSTILGYPTEVLARYDVCIQLAQKIISEIDQGYK